MNAMREFRQGFDQYRDERASFDEGAEKAKVERYYREEFSSEYQNRNADAAPSASRLMSSLDEDSIAFQHDFIANNPKPLGQKDGLTSLDNQTLYSKLHEIYHPPIRDFLQRFEYYDIFLVAPDTGDIIYSVYKELDFSTSLIDGPYADSGIGRVFRQVRNASNEDAVAIADFEHYLPSYEDPAAFIASPIFEKGEMLGVLIFQMPVDRIKAIMTYGEKWVEHGLGASGETYLVGDDFNQPRFVHRLAVTRER